MKAGKDESNPKTLATTKKCSCGNNRLILLRTLNLKICPDCDTYIRWVLTDKQQLIA